MDAHILLLVWANVAIAGVLRYDAILHKSSGGNSSMFNFFENKKVSCFGHVFFCSRTFSVFFQIYKHSRFTLVFLDSKTR